jgi:hypothetical protein
VRHMPFANKIYRRATNLDPWEGSYPPDDTGSSGLAAAKAAQKGGWGGEYRHLFGGVDEVVQTILGGRVVNIGTWWYESMFDQDSSGRIEVVGAPAGGHQWIARGYDVDRDWVLGRCWWGSFRDFWIARTTLGELLADDGDALTQDVLVA